MRYVKICPRCGRENDELNEACENDGEFLGMVPATIGSDRPSIPSVAPLEEPACAAPPPADPQSATSPHGAASVAVTPRFQQPTHVLYVETAAGVSHEVRNGSVIGQAHPSSAAHIQLEGLPGVNFVHRSHCMFEYRADGWYVAAIAQPNYTNPTFVNQKRIAPGQNVRLRNGDKLALSNVTLNIRIIEL